jgi:hypothetical protein
MTKMPFLTGAEDHQPHPCWRDQRVGSERNCTQKEIQRTVRDFTKAAFGRESDIELAVQDKTQNAAAAKLRKGFFLR